MDALQARLQAAVSRADYAEAASIQQEIKLFQAKPDPLADLRARLAAAVQNADYAAAASLQQEIKALEQGKPPRKKLKGCTGDIIQFDATSFVKTGTTTTKGAQFLNNNGGAHVDTEYAVVTGGGLHSVVFSMASPDVRKVKILINGRCIVNPNASDGLFLNVATRGGWTDWEDVEVGTVDFGQAGESTFSIRSTSFHPHIKSICLKPLSGSESAHYHRHETKMSSDTIPCKPTRTEPKQMHTPSPSAEVPVYSEVRFGKKYDYEIPPQFRSTSNTPGELKWDGAWLRDQLAKAAQRRSNNQGPWITPPSVNLSANSVVHEIKDFCYTENTQPANPDYQPDMKYWGQAVNCEGLWILATKACPPGVAEHAAQFVRAYVPIELRQLCLQWRAPKGRPRGPLRVVYAWSDPQDKAGDMPDFPDSWPFYMSVTVNPALFSHPNDVKYDGHGANLAHELTHLLDMAIRQQLDPYMMEELDNLYNQAFTKNTYGKCYAAANRHEYFAEVVCLWLGIGKRCTFSGGCGQCGAAPDGFCGFAPHGAHRNPPGACKPDPNKFVHKNDLLRLDPNAYQFVSRYFKEMPNLREFADHVRSYPESN